jgi:adenylate cyclase
MKSGIPALRRKRLRMWLAVMAVSAVLGALYGAFLASHFGLAGLRPRVIVVLTSTLHGVLMGGSISACEIFLMQSAAARRLQALPFLALVALKTLAYGAIVIAVDAGAPGPRALGALVGRDPLVADMIAPATALTVAFSLAVTLLFVLSVQGAQLLGFRTARDLVLGRYRKPRRERRFFLFVDVVGSTGIAERLGPLEAHRFLAAVFAALAEPVAAWRGEIYQYVGDEIVVTWTEAEGTGGKPPEARPVHCFFAMEAALGALAPELLRRFGAEPALRAALHLGDVIAGEVGVWRRAIVFHGDVMNTASRLENATREVGRRFIASAEALRSVGPPAQLWQSVRCHDLGALELRGRKEPVQAYGIERLEAGALQ